MFKTIESKLYKVTCFAKRYYRSMRGTWRGFCVHVLLRRYFHDSMSSMMLSRPSMDVAYTAMHIPVVEKRGTNECKFTSPVQRSSVLKLTNWRCNGAHFNPCNGFSMLVLMLYITNYSAKDENLTLFITASESRQRWDEQKLNFSL